MSNFNPQFAKIGDILVYNKTINFYPKIKLTNHTNDYIMKNI